MDIYTLDSLNGVTGIVEVFESCIWNCQFFGVNDFELKVVGIKQNVDLLAIGTYLVRDMDVNEDGYDNVMVIQRREISYDAEKGWILTVSGGGLKTLLSRRVVWSQTNLVGSLEDGIRQVVTDNVINPAESMRRIDNFVLADPIGFTRKIDVQLLGEKIHEWLSEICNQYGLGWDVYIRNGKYVFELIEGTDRTYNQDTVVPVVFSPNFDNLINAKYTDDREDYCNAVLVGGEGEGANQVTAQVGNDTGLDRFEDYVDGGSVSSNGEIITMETYISMLENYGQDHLSKAELTEQYEGQVTPDGIYTVNKDYFLGDLVQMDNGIIRSQSRIIEIIYSEDENGFSLVPTFGTWEKEPDVLVDQDDNPIVTNDDYDLEVGKNG